MEEILPNTWAYIYAMGSMTIRSPLDRYIILCKTKSLSTAPTPYTSIWKYLTTVHKLEGIKGYWRGNFSHILNYASATATSNLSSAYIYFLAFSLWQHNNSDSFALSAEVASIGFTKLVAFPFDKVRTVLCCDISSKNNKQYTGIYHCMKETVKAKGFFSLYEGYTISLSTFMIYLGANYYSQQTAKRLTDSPMYQIVLIVSAKYLTQFITYPLDLIKSRKQVIGEHMYASESKSFASIVSKIYKTEGLIGFYRGFLVWNVQFLSFFIAAQLMSI